MMGYILCKIATFTEKSGFTSTAWLVVKLMAHEHTLVYN